MDEYTPFAKSAQSIDVVNAKDQTIFINKNTKCIYLMYFLVLFPFVALSLVPICPKNR